MSKFSLRTGYLKCHGADGVDEVQQQMQEAPLYSED